MVRFIIPVILIILGVVIFAGGLIFRFMHWPYGTEMLLISAAISIIALLVFIIQLSRPKK